MSDGCLSEGGEQEDGWSDCDEDIDYDKEDQNNEANGGSEIEEDFSLGDKGNIKNRKLLSLKENCLECVVRNFERFNTAHLSSEDAVLRRNLEFLKRVYTSHIIHGLAEAGKLADKHLDFLINEHLKELNVEFFVENRCSLEVIKKRIAAVGHGFKKVSFDIPCGIWDDDISEFLSEAICHLSNVEILYILDHCNDTILKQISIFCTKLSELNIGCSNSVTDEGLKLLCKEKGEDQAGCPIKILSMKYTKVSESAISFLLSNMPSLEVLDYYDLPNIIYSLHKDDFKNNTLNNVKKYNLTKLDFFFANCSFPQLHTLRADILHVWTELCPNIKTLCIQIEKQDCLDLISRFSNLENLNIKCATTGNSRIAIDNYLKLNGTKLKSLEIHGFNLSISTLMGNCLKLENLTLTDILFQSLGGCNRGNFNSLRELSVNLLTFSNQYAEDSITNLLLKSPNLEKLSFENCKFEDSEMNTKLAKFCEKCALQHLTFYGCDIDVALVESIILTCSSLISLTIGSCENIRENDAINLHDLQETTKSSMKVHIDCDESEEHSMYDDDDDDFYDNIYSDDYDEYDNYDSYYDDPYFCYDPQDWG